MLEPTQGLGRFLPAGAYLVPLFAAILLAGVMLWSNGEHRRVILQQTKGQADGLALVLARHTAAAVAEGEMALRTMAATIDPAAMADPRGRAAARAVMVAQLRHGPQFLWALATDADGVVVVASEDLAASPPDLAHHSIIADLRSRRPSAPTLFPPAKVLGDLPVLTLGHALADQDGRFAGALLLGFSAGYFTEQYRLVEQGFRGRVELRHVDGALVATAGAAAPGVSTPVIAASAVGAEPLELRVALQVEPALGVWRALWGQQALVSGLAMLLLLGVAVTFWRTARRLVAAEKAERSQRRLLEEMIAGLDYGIVVLDRDARLQVFNPAAQRIFPLPEFKLGQTRPGSDVKVFAEDGETPAPFNSRPLWRALRGEVVRDMATVIEHADGRRVYVLGSGLPLRDGDTIIGAVGIYRDVTATRTLERQLQQAQKMEAVGQLTGGMAHDFNNLLTVIMGSADELLGDPAVGARERQLAEMIANAAERGAELTQRMLAFARRQMLAPRPVDVPRLFHDLGPLLTRTLGENIQVRARLPDDLWRCYADTAQLEAAILNLALNARDAMPDGGALTIKAANVTVEPGLDQHHADLAPGDYVMIAVGDTGHGMDAATLARACEPFFTTKEVGRGSGLGLSMVYGFAKQSGGHVAITSEPGRGTVVRLYLPRREEPATADVGAPAVPPVAGHECILLVEDDSQVRAQVEGQLRRLGYIVHAVPDGPAAMAMLPTLPKVDLLLTDMVMPGGVNGRQLALMVREARPGIGILFTSGFADSATPRAARFGAVELILTKPYRLRDLAGKVREALAARPKAA